MISMINHESAYMSMLFDSRPADLFCSKDDGCIHWRSNEWLILLLVIVIKSDSEFLHNSCSPSQIYLNIK